MYPVLNQIDTYTYRIWLLDFCTRIASGFRFFFRFSVFVFQTFSFFVSVLITVSRRIIDEKKNEIDFSRAQQEERLRQIKGNNAVLEHVVTCQDQRCRVVKCEKMKVNQLTCWYS